MSKTLFDIEGAAVDKAIELLRRVRPDLNGADTIRLARLVAAEAAMETVIGLRAEGLLVEDKEPVREAVKPEPFNPRAEDIIDLGVAALKMFSGATSGGSRRTVLDIAEGFRRAAADREDRR